MAFPASGRLEEGIPKELGFARQRLEAETPSDR
jgi:hypothetical protein